MIYIFLAQGFEEIEAITITDVLRRAKLGVSLISITEEYDVKGSHDIIIKSDKLIRDIELSTEDVLILPGGMPGAANLKNSDILNEMLRMADKNKSTIAAICAAPIVLENSGIIKEKKITSYPSFKEVFEESYYVDEKIVHDKNIITSQGPATALAFSLYLVEFLKDKAAASELAEAMLINKFENIIQ